MNIVMSEVISYLTKDGKYDIRKHDNLFDKGLLDSMGVLEIISIIEEASGIDFDPEFFIIENFKSINSIERFILQEAND